MTLETFDPVRREELRIMGYGDVVGDDDMGSVMARVITADGPIDTTRGRVEAQVGDYFLEYATGATEHLTADEFATLDLVLIPPDATPPSDEPVALAEPAGLLQRESDDNQGAAAE